LRRKPLVVGISLNCGGSFNNESRNVRAAIRNRNNNPNNNIGFRVALAHNSQSFIFIPPVNLSAHVSADEAKQER
jgi:hypothetical protein